MTKHYNLSRLFNDEYDPTRTKKADLSDLMAETNDLIKEAKDYLHANGIKYDLSQWVTIKEYAKRHNIDSTNAVSNWISRGTIMPEDIRDFPGLNNLRLIRNKEYK